MLLSLEEFEALGYNGAENPEECEKAIMRAQRMIDLLTDGKCREYEKNPVCESVLGHLKNAVGAQAEHYLEAGTVCVFGKTTIGDFSFSPDRDCISTVSPLAMAILKFSGLYYRGAKTA